MYLYDVTSRTGDIQSGKEVYHVMVRGINRQQIFESVEDNKHILYALSNHDLQYNPDGIPLPSPTCVIYAYSLMCNHIHLLIKEKELTIDMIENICNTRATLGRISIEDLAALVNKPLADDCTCIDIDEADIHSKSVHTDESVRSALLRLSQCQTVAEFQRKDITERKQICRQLKARANESRASNIFESYAECS